MQVFTHGQGLKFGWPTAKALTDSLSSGEESEVDVTELQTNEARAISLKTSLEGKGGPRIDEVV